MGFWKTGHEGGSGVSLSFSHEGQSSVSSTPMMCQSAAAIDTSTATKLTHQIVDSRNTNIPRGNEVSNERLVVILATVRKHPLPVHHEYHVGVLNLGELQPLTLSSG